MQSNDIMVSINCIAYNHEKYIRKCLDGLLMQQTSFQYEILVHDDASTDHTADIIREYEKRYPDIIKPIYQTENQYSKGIDISQEYQLPRMQGKYVAVCEGDDYWINPFKLQKQFDYLENNPSCMISTHRAYKMDLRNNTKSLFPPDEEKEKDFDAEEIILKGGGYFATCADMYRKKEFIDRPACFNAKGFGDIPLRMWGAINGGIHYLPDVMSVYNYASEGSWTNRVYFNKRKRKGNLLEHINLLERIDKFYNYIYNSPFQKRINGLKYAYNLLSGNIIGIHRKQYHDYYLESKKNGFNPDKECLTNAFPIIHKIKHKLNRE